MTRGEPQLAARLLLQCRGGERRCGTAGVGLLLDRAHGDIYAVERLCQSRRGDLVEVQDGRRAELAAVVEVLAGGDPRPVDGGQARCEGAGVLLLRRKGGGQVPVTGRAERHPLALALDDQTRGDGLHAPCGQTLSHLAPQHRRQLIAVEPVQDPPRLLGVDQPVVEVAGRAQRPLQGLAGDLVEHHAVHRHLGLQGLEQVPGDGLALAVLICGEVELVSVLEQPLELGHLLSLVDVDHVVRLEPAVDVDGELAEGALLHLGRQLAGLRQVTDVPHAGLDVITGAQVAGDGLGLRRRLDDDESSKGGVGLRASHSPAFHTVRRC